MIAHIEHHFPYYLILLVTLILADGLVTNIIVEKGYGFEASIVLTPLIGTGLIIAKSIGAVTVVGMFANWYYLKCRIASFVLNIGLAVYTFLFLWNATIYHLGEVLL